MHPEKIKLIFVTLEVFHLDISGNDINEWQSSKHPKCFPIVLTLEKSHFEISGNEVND